MKVRVCNLGAVKHAEIDVKPFTVFVGRNNAGKTWTAYLLAGIFGQHGWEKYIQAYVKEERTERFPVLDALILQLIKEGNAKIDIVRFVEEHGEEYFNAVARLSQDWMQDFMKTERTDFANLEVKVKLEERQIDLQNKVKALTSESGLGSQVRVQKEVNDSTLYFFAEDDLLEKLPHSAIPQFVAVSMFGVLQRSLYSNTYIFPTERTAFTAFPFSHSILIQENERGVREASVKPYIRPVERFLDMVRYIANNDSLAEREKRAKKESPIRTYIELGRLLETKILSGGIDYSISDSGLGRELLYRPAKDVALEIPIVSSMVKELTPLVLYLRYLAQPGDWLIIDEPEMNLHPDAQVRLTEFLAMLVHAGLHVLITTHSSYIVDHLANLIKAAEHSDKEEIKDLFFLKETDAFLPQEQAAVYLFEKGTARSILDSEGNIDWGTFANVSDRISDIYHKL